MPKIRGIKPDLWTDEDFVELTPFARLLWLGMWNYACDNGHLADKSKQIKMRVLPTDDVNCAELLREIASQGLIHRVDGWITIPNLTRHQKPDRRYFTTCPKEGCEAPPETVSQRAARRAPTVHTSGAQGVHDVCTPGAHVDGEVKGSDGDGEGINNVGALTLAEAPRPDVERICQHLADRIEDNGSKKPTITAKWRTAARLMLDRDGRTEADVLAAINWCQDDDFWRSNILSLPTLREKYDTLRLQAQRQPRTKRQAAEDDMWARAMQRAEARERGDLA